MADEGPAALRARYAALDERLDAAAMPAGERDAVKGDIIALIREIDGEVSALAALKEEVKALAARWKTLRDAAIPAPAPLARPVVADHLNASTFIDRGWSRIAAGDPAGAEAVLRRALELAPGDPQAESLLGWAQMLQEKHDEALLNLQRVLSREPGNAMARINVGYICLKKRIFGEAIEHLSGALRLDADRKAMLYAHFYLGLVYLEREMYEDAQTFFRQTLELGPNLVEAYYELGRALWFGGEREQAMRAWRNGGAANKFNSWGKRCTEVLTAVEGGGEPPGVGG